MTLLQTDIIESLSKHLSGKALENLVNYTMTLGKNVIAALIIYFLGRFIIGKILKIVRKIMQKKGIEPSLYSFFDSLITISLYFVLIIAIIGILGIETSSFVALFASAGVAIGMAMSGTLQNFAGGVMILLFRPFRVGHYIEAQGFAGTVKEIQIFNTIITTVDNQTIIIPNGGLSTGCIKNYSSQPNRRVDINVEVAYGTNPDDVREVLNKIINADERIIKTAGLEPAIPMISMATSSIIFQMRLWTASANYWDVLFDTTEKSYKALTSKGIEIPFQQLDVHLHNKD
ncbi:MAG: mechanosensitive ion channel [Bacteroidaceae bacterium]|nr:mechanosensitive ion channel [Bacteroidaceae bacterium]